MGLPKRSKNKTSTKKTSTKKTSTKTSTKTSIKNSNKKTKINKKMCSNVFKCKYPYICNLCYEQHKTDEFIEDIEFHPYIYKNNVIRCNNCRDTTFYIGEDKVSRKVLNDIRKQKTEIYKNIINEHCAYSKCGKKLPLLSTSSNTVKFEICHKCLPNMKELLPNYFTETNNILSTFGNCNTCKYKDGIYKMHKKCYDNFITANSKQK